MFRGFESFCATLPFMDYRCPRAITGSVTSGLSICLCQLHDTWIALILCASRNERGQRVKRLTAVNLSETRELHPLCSSNRGGFKEGLKRHRFDQRKRTIRGFSVVGLLFLGITIVIRKIWFMGNEDFEKLWRDHIRLFGVEKINAITAATLLTQPQYDTRASLST